MGFFDKFFNKKETNPTYIKKNKEWEQELDSLISLGQLSERPINYLSPDHRFYNDAKYLFLSFYNIGIKKTKPEEINIDENLQNGFRSNSINDFLELISFSKTKWTESTFNATIGYIEYSLFYLQKEDSNWTKYKSFIYDLNRYDYSDFLLYALENMNKIQFQGKLYIYIDCYIKLQGKKFLDIKEKLFELIISENGYLADGKTQIFQNEDAVLSYLNIRRNQIELIRKKYKLKLKENEFIDKYLNLFALQTTSENQECLGLLLLYQLSYDSLDETYEKKLLTYVLKNLNINYRFLHAVINIFIQSPYTFHINTYIKKIINNYFKNKELDPSSFRLLSSFLFRRDALSIYIHRFFFNIDNSQINNYFFQNIKLLHSGLIHRALQDYDGYTYDSGINKKRNEYINNLLLLLSQIIETTIVQEGNMKQSPKIQIDDYKLNLYDNYSLDRINKLLFDKQLPYQLVSIFKHNKNLNISFEHPDIALTLLLNKEEYSELAQFVNNNDFGYYFRLIYGSIDFFDSKTDAPALPKSMNEVKKAKKEKIGSNVFINDIKWSGVKRNIIDNLPDKKTWYSIMNAIVSCPAGVSPSEKWFNRFKQSISNIPEENFEIGIDRLNYDISKNLTWFSNSYKNGLKGIIWANTFLDPEVASHNLREILKHSYEKIPGSGPRNTQAGASCMAALIHIDKPESYKVLSELYKKTRYPRFKKQLLAALSTFEKKSKIAVSVLKEASQKDFGFKDDKVIKLYEVGYSIQWTIVKRKAKSQWIDKSGEKLSKSPLSSNPEVKKEVTQITKSINDAIIDFDARMSSYRFADITWTYDQWCKNYINHEFIKQIINNFLWTSETKSNRTVFITKNNKTFDINNKEIQINNDALIKPYHKTFVSKEENENWMKYFINHKITPKVEYFYSILFTKEDLSSLLSFLENKLEYLIVDGWKEIRNEDYHGIAKDLSYLGKTVLIGLNSIDNKNKLTIKYFVTPLKKRSKTSYKLEELGQEIPSKSIPDKVHIELVNELIMQSIYLNDSFIERLTKNEIMSIPYFKFLDHFFKTIDDKKIFPAYSYKDLEISIKGKYNTYNILITKNKVNIREREKNSKYHLKDKLKPKKNYSQIIEIPFVYDMKINKYLWAIEQLSSDDNIKVKYLDNWVNNK